MASGKTIDRIRALHHAADTLSGFEQKYSQATQNSSCDKKGYGFGRDNRFAAFKITTSFDSWLGYFGSSGCHTALSVDGNTVEPFIIKALNQHWRQIFETASEMMREEASSLTAAAREELKKAEELLDRAVSQ